MKKLFLVFALFLSLSSFVHAESDEYLTRAEGVEIILDSLDLDFDLKEIDCDLLRRYRDLAKGDTGTAFICMNRGYELGGKWRPNEALINRDLFKMIAQSYHLELFRDNTKGDDYFIQLLEKAGVKEINTLPLEEKTTKEVINKILSQLNVPEFINIKSGLVGKGQRVGALNVTKVISHEEWNRDTGKKDIVIMNDFELRFDEPVILEGKYYDNRGGMQGGISFHPDNEEWKVLFIENEKGRFLWGNEIWIYDISRGEKIESIPVGSSGKARIKISGVRYIAGGGSRLSYLKALGYEILNYSVLGEGKKIDENLLVKSVK